MKKSDEAPTDEHFNLEKRKVPSRPGRHPAISSRYRRHRSRRGYRLFVSGPDSTLLPTVCPTGVTTVKPPPPQRVVWTTSARRLRTALESPGTRPAGCYHVRADAWGRSFNPSGFDAGPSANWYINQGAFSWNRVSRSISVVDV